jgi:hypothetical protein
MAILSDNLMDCVERLHAADFTLPLTFSLISANGVLFAGKYTGPWGVAGVEILHEPVEPLRLPLYLMFVDARGAAAGFVLSADTEPPYFVPLPAHPEH